MTSPRPPLRSELIGSVLESVTALSRELTAGREPPFDRRLTRNQMETLFVLAHSAEPVTPKHLASGLGVTAGAITQLVDGLISQDLVESTAHPSDARSRVLRLTDSAQATVDRFERAAVDRLAHRFNGLDDEQLRALAASLAAVAAGRSG
ncbi:MAG TPA: MarR family transcriptional regulator [Propionibacteriaceae bacterium]|jgi:DNA-binding MarR family transcriptional regulator|nr:MarR family transcriptional regulator [Propionibacteriaceae bacterium]